MKDNNLLPIKKYLLIGLGSISLAFGVVGVFIPLLPTTPFLILAAYSFMKSSQKLYDWLLGHKILGPYLHSYIHHRSIDVRVRRYALVMLWITIIISTLLAPIALIKIILPIIALLVTWHLMSLKTHKK